MNEIKVTVSYEKPATTKFDALMEEYKAAKKIADETVAYYKPLADAAEDAKFDAIMEQLETIKEYAKKICELQNMKYRVVINVYINAAERGCRYLSDGSAEFKVSYEQKDGYQIKWKGYEFTKSEMHQYPHLMCSDTNNIIGKWDEWGVYKKLEAEACLMLKREITRQKDRAAKQIDRLNNIQKEV